MGSTFFFTQGNSLVRTGIFYNVFTILSAGFMNLFLALEQDWFCFESRQSAIKNGIREKGLIFENKQKIIIFKVKWKKINS